MDLGMQQKEVAKMTGLAHVNISAWESGRSTPMVEYYPAIIKFLGFNPLSSPQTIAEKIRYYRMAMGLYRRELADLVEVSQDTVKQWENGAWKPNEESMGRLRKVLGDVGFE